MKQLNQKTPWVFRLGVALLCVMLMTTHFTGNLYARYSTTATGSDSARVAKFAGGTIAVTQTEEQTKYSFDVNIGDGDGEKPDIVYDQKGYYEVRASFDVNVPVAEVARTYTLVLTLARIGSVDIADMEVTFKTPASGYSFTDEGMKNTDLWERTVSEDYIGTYVSQTEADTFVSITWQLKPNEGTSFTFSVPYYVPISIINNNIQIESAYMTCELICEQVD